jgi:hypothetical protein
MSSVPLIHVPSSIVVLKTITLLLGGLITFLSFRASRRTGAKPLRLLAAGFALVTLGSLLAGVIDIASSMDVSGVLTRRGAIIVESALMTLGFAVIVYSLYSQQ